MKQKLLETSKERLVGQLSLGMLGLVGLALLMPLAPKTVQAEDNTKVAAETLVNVNSMVSVALQSGVNIDVYPQISGGFASETAKLSVMTNNRSGYAVYMTTRDGEANLVSTDATNRAIIKPVAAGVLAEDFGLNTWGYSLGKTANRLYDPVPTSEQEILHTDTTAYLDEYDLTFGVAVSGDLPTGSYRNEVVVSVVANPAIVTSLDQMTYMQGVTPEICGNTAEGVTKRLTDVRDGKKYWVAKLKDGNCWMTQNLALDITEEGLKAATTDIAVDWNMRSSAPPVPTNQSTAMGEREAISWGPGEVVLATPLYAKSCGSNISSGALVQSCAKVGFVDVSGDDWQPTFEAIEGKITLGDGTEYEGLIAVDEVNKTYDAHYLVGNYYSIVAARAGTSNYSSATDQANAKSICPKGWSAPNGGSSLFETNGTYTYLLRQYKLVTSGTAGVLANEDYNVATKPFYFTRAGEVVSARSDGTGNVNAAGDTGFLRTLSYVTNAGSYTVSFTGTALNPSASLTREHGGSLRCRVLGATADNE